MMVGKSRDQHEIRFSAKLLMHFSRDPLACTPKGMLFRTLRSLQGSVHVAVKDLNARLYVRVSCTAVAV